MAQPNTLAPGTGTQMVGFEPWTWTNPGNITVDDLNYASSQVNLGDATITDNSVKLIDDLGNPVGDDKPLAGAWASSQTLYTYGGETDMWGTFLTRNQVIDTDFGWYIQFIDSISSGTSSRLRASNYGFALPIKTKMVGFKPEAKKFRTYNSRLGITTVNVGYMPMTVYYDYNYPQVRIISFLVPFFSKLLSAITATGILNTFDIIKLSYKDGLVVHKAQTRCAGKLEFI
jgi:hypothetical protein